MVSACVNGKGAMCGCMRKMVCACVDGKGAMCGCEKGFRLFWMLCRSSAAL
jgi:hypothetical protein